MPGLLHRTAQFSHGPAAAGSLSSHGIWSKHATDIGFDQLQKFWSQLPVEARQELLKVDKHALFEQARKNLYCSRCNGLLLEGFSQIVMYGKSLQQESACMYPNRMVHSTVQGDSDSEVDDVLDPSVHPWGGLATTRDGILTLLDCFISARSLKALQNVFNSARARERERELLYPDACGGGGRGWISQGMISYGRGHGTRETCALHTARLSCDTLVDFWSALSDETRLSLLRMKEEDFIERLMYRFDSKRFCRDCRRNVIREFKELKELKRMRREPRCSSWFCVADTAFQYEVSEDTVQADWHQSFTESVGTYHHFEWAIGTGEGKSDILEFEDVGMDGKVYMNGLDLGGLSACFITLRAWKLDGRCTELCVKAHALKGQPCVHRRLIVGDGFVTITKGESIRDFFEHAEEVEEEEDDDAMDKDGNEYDGDGSRPQKHAKSPELAREFLLDAATVIFKEQVEKAFREGTARQNAHSIFVCLSLKLLEDRIHVACKEIITLEKQTKLLEEEEKDRREEEERKERRRTKEREKKLRRKERLKGKERERERKHMEPELLHFALPPCNDSSTSTHDDSPNTVDSGDSISEAGDIGGLSNPISPNEESLENPKSGSVWHQCQVDGEVSPRDGRDSFLPEQFKSSRRKLRVKRETLFDQASKWYDKRHSVHNEETAIQHYESDRTTHGYAMDTFRCNTGVLREKIVKTNTRPCNLKFSEKFHCSNSRTRDRYDFQSCSCNQQDECRQKDEFRYTTVRQGRVIRSTNKTETSPDGPRTLFRGRCGIPEGKIVVGREVVHTKQVWEPMDARKKCAKSISDPDVTVSNTVKPDLREVGSDKDEQCCDVPLSTPDGPCSLSSLIELEDGREGSKKSDSDALYEPQYCPKNETDNESKSSPGTVNDCDPIMLSSSSDTFSSCPSEGGSITGSSTAQNTESSSTSDSEDACQQSDGNGNENASCDDLDCKTNEDGNGNENENASCDDLDCKTNEDVPLRRITTGTPTHEPINTIPKSSNSSLVSDMPPHPQQHMPPMHDHSMHMPVFPSTMGFHNHNVSLWSANTPTNGLIPFPQHSQYMYPSPFGYGVSVNQSPGFPMQYNTVQPLLSIQQRPLYQSADRVYVPSMNEKTKSLDGAPVLPRNGYPLERPCSTRLNGGVDNVAKPNKDAPSFSLFHFGGPYNVNPAPLKEQISCGFASNITCSKEETKIEEYSLFAASTGSRFSFF